MTIYATRNCLVCGTEFTANKNNPDKRYCTQYCWTQSRKTIHQPRNCKLCDKEFVPQNHTSKQYCSPECGITQKGVRGRKPGKWGIFTCKWCGKEFEAYVYRNPTMCSAQCRSEYGARQPKPNARKPEIYVTKNCSECGKEYQTTTHQMRLRGSSCCSRACVAKRVSRTKTGIHHHNYRGRPSTYRGANWSKQQRAAIKRDNYCCGVCGVKVGKRKHDHAVHHITPFREFQGDYIKANDLSNLITVCRKCHGLAEWGKIYVQRSLL